MEILLSRNCSPFFLFLAVQEKEDNFSTLTALLNRVQLSRKSIGVISVQQLHG